MAALRHSLQRELFLPAEERLVGLVHVTSAGKKKKVPCFLCIAITSDQSVGANIYKVICLTFYLTLEILYFTIVGLTGQENREKCLQEETNVVLERVEIGGWN